MTLREIANKVLDTPLQSFLPNGETVMQVVLVLVLGYYFFAIVGGIVGGVADAINNRREKLRKAAAPAKHRIQMPTTASK